MRKLMWVMSVLALGLVGCSKPTEPLEPTPDEMAPATQSSGADTSGKSILFISNANSPFWNAVDVGLQAGAKEFGIDARLERNVAGSVEGQIQLLEQALAQKDELAGVAISVLRPDAEGILSLMRQLRDAGVPVITVDSDCAKDARDAFIGTNNLEAGKALGQKAAELSPDGAKCCVFVGDPSAQNAKERLDGFKQGAGDKFEVLEVYKDDVDPSIAKSNVETALTSHTETTLLVGLWSYNGPAIAEVVQEQGKGDDVMVLCFDAEPNLLPLLEQGKVKATVVQRPYEFGRLGVKLLKALCEKNEAAAQEVLNGSDVVDTGIVVVTSESYPEFKAYLDEKGLQSS